MVVVVVTYIFTFESRRNNCLIIGQTLMFIVQAEEP